MTAGLTDVHISVVNTDNRALLERCLASLPAACEGITWRVTVVDNASTDGSADLVRAQFPWASLVNNARREGVTSNHNKGMRPAIEKRDARYVLILNEDTELAPESVTRLVERADREPLTGAIGPRIQGPQGQYEQSLFAFPTVTSEALRTLRPGKRSARKTPSEGWLNSSCVLVSVDALRDVGGFDERFFIFYDDTDLGRRLADGGWRSVMCDQALVIHVGHQTVSRPSSGPMEQQFLRSQYLYFRKHASRSNAELVSALVRGALALRATKALIGGVLTTDGEERQLARQLFRLARYNPRRLLEHERPILDGSP